MLQSIPCREFARSAARMAGAIGIATIVPRHVLGRPGTIAPSEKINVAGIGIGLMGPHNLANLEKENIVALCDGDADYAAPTIKKYPGAKFFGDCREILNKQKDIDAVVVATPEHTHAIISIYPWGHAVWSSQWSDRPKETPPVPAGLKGDLWIGPAPMRPYHRAYQPLTWRCFWDFGCGMMGDRGAHTLDAVCAALKRGTPTSVDATSCGNTPEVHPLSAIVTFGLPGREGFPPLKLTWYEGTRPPRREELKDGRPFPAEGGALFKGTKGTIMAGVYCDNPQIIPEEKMKQTSLPPKSLPRLDISHEEDWVRACKTGQPAGADFAYAGPLTEICLLGNIAKRVDTRIEWDAENLKITNLPGANRYVRTQYRPGSTL